MAIYVDDVNIIGTPNFVREAQLLHTQRFEMKDLGNTSFCLGLQIERNEKGIFLHQTTYLRRVLQRFAMHDAHPLSTPMVVRHLGPSTDPFRPAEDDKESILGPETPYLAAIGALMYLLLRVTL